MHTLEESTKLAAQENQDDKIAEAYRRAGIRMVVFSVALATGMLVTLY